MKIDHFVDENEPVTEKKTFHSYIKVNQKGTDEHDFMVVRVLESLATFQMRGSGWTVNSIVALEIHTVAYEPLRGNSYIPLPTKLMQKKAIITMKNEDNKCFTWTVLRALNLKEKDNERVDKELKKIEEQLNMGGIEYPVSLNAINKSINILGYNYEEDVYPLRVSKHTFLLIGGATINRRLI